MTREDAWKGGAQNKPGPIQGRRMWALCRDRERWRLTNIAHATDEYWPRGVYEADCAMWGNHTDRTPSPHPSCHCGLYAFWNMSELERQQHIGMVTGIVLAWGRVRPGIEGFKAQYMMPIAVDLPMCQSYSCEEPATIGRISPHWTEPYPSYSFDPEGYRDAWEWVNCRSSAVSWLCDTHAISMAMTAETSSQGESGFTVDVQTVYGDLERYYECDVLPAGLDVSSSWDDVMNDQRKDPPS